MQWANANAFAYACSWVKALINVNTHFAGCTCASTYVLRILCAHMCVYLHTAAHSPTLQTQIVCVFFVCVSLCRMPLPRNKHIFYLARWQHNISTSSLKLCQRKSGRRHSQISQSLIRALGAFVKLIYKLETFLFEFHSAFLGDVLCGNCGNTKQNTGIFGIFTTVSIWRNWSGW